MKPVEYVASNQSPRLHQTERTETTVSSNDKISIQTDTFEHHKTNRDLPTTTDAAPPFPASSYQFSISAEILSSTQTNEVTVENRSAGGSVR